PSIYIRYMLDDANGEVLQATSHKAISYHHDRVKVVFCPVFFSSPSLLIDLDYEEFHACHVGIFVSFTSDVDRTPAACMLIEVTSVLMNLNAFECFINEHVTDSRTCGIYVVDRRFKDASDSKNELIDRMYEFT
ncbi:hypothetical protein Angca_004508, partial [Angiostrongylus cantonensis]